MASSRMRHPLCVVVGEDTVWHQIDAVAMMAMQGDLVNCSCALESIHLHLMFAMEEDLVVVLICVIVNHPILEINVNLSWPQIFH